MTSKLTEFASSIDFSESRKRLQETRRVLTSSVASAASQANRALRPVARAAAATKEATSTALAPVAKKVHEKLDPVAAAAATAMAPLVETVKDHLPDMETLQRIFKLWDYYKVADDLGYVKSEVMGVFSLFAFSKKDVKAYLLALEVVDKRFTQTVKVREFADRYCGSHGNTFCFLWKSWHALYRTVIKGGGGEKATILRQEKKGEHDDSELDVGVDRKRPNYIHFTGFLMFIMTIADTDLQRLLYWMWYYQPQRRPKKDNLMAYFGSIWGEFDEDQVAEYDSRKKRLRAALDLIIMKEFSYRVFQITDWKAGGAWTTPVRKLRQHLVQSFIGEEFWKRVTPLVGRIDDDVHAAIGRLEDAPLPIPQCLTDLRARLEEVSTDKHFHEADANDGMSERGDESPRAESVEFSPTKRHKELKALQQQMDKYWKHAGTRIDGRKKARKELRHFLRVFRSYDEMGVDSFGDEFGDGPAMGQFFKMVYRGAKQAATTLKEFVWELKMALRHEDSVVNEGDSEDETDADELNAFLDEVTIDEESSVGPATVSVSSATPGFVGLPIEADAAVAVDDDSSVLMPVDPEVKYKAALKVPVEALHSMAATARSRVVVILDELEAIQRGGALLQLTGPESRVGSEAGSRGGDRVGSRTGSEASGGQPGAKRLLTRRGSKSQVSKGSGGSQRSKGSVSLYSRDSQEGSKIESIVEDPREDASVLDALAQDDDDGDGDGDGDGESSHRAPGGPNSATAGTKSKPGTPAKGTGK